MGDRGIIMTLVIGLLVGIVAKFLKPGKDPGGIIVTILLGIAGSFVATYAGQAIGWYTVGQTAGFIASVIGAILLLVLYGLVTKKR
ncbi:MAG TPA: GlsB/YeaQ/YmgE family stress response membrane protein [Dokdonella sp.]|uniref:GlsB/YeaQ/YmgE family stress response membrane protein n=1 Tax=Dokdonella sp. TaxID=2291710 RepID=UPI0025BDB47C|nr:GlsB/YeaQ/YmgE family stress response membrane protein [Dokdonella sp.]MBX3692848.1 GlsB/YeaQ/YmgE family stress response membrane protein [Dokdonella sp.]HNR91527.1 GlsB/YeaQ/YmgE family stress response membrane protein [Dokdonella sp.]